MRNPFPKAVRMLLTAPIGGRCNFGVCPSSGTATGDDVWTTGVSSGLPLPILLRPRTGALRLFHRGVTRIQSRLALRSPLAIQLALVVIVCLASSAQPARPNPGTNSSHYEFQ